MLTAPVFRKHSFVKMSFHESFEMSLAISLDEQAQTHQINEKALRINDSQIRIYEIGRNW